MKKQKKPFILSRFTPYMGKKKMLLPLSLVLSALSAISNVLPFVLVWIVVRKILASPQAIQTLNVRYYAWLGFGAALLGLLLYFLALMSSHLAAFHVEVGLQQVGMEKILSKPLGFFDQYPSGKIRKIVNDGAATTHVFLAHQLPDLSGSIIAPLILLVLFFVVDWRMGLASLIPLALGFIAMNFMMNQKGKALQQKYFDSLEEMSAESVEYVRNIPVVKTFGQSIFSFKRFYDSIIRYKDMVSTFTALWRKPMSFYTVIMQSAAFFLVPAAILLIGRGASLPVVLSDFVFYMLISPVFTTLLMRSMYFQQNANIAAQVIDRLDELFDYADMTKGQEQKPLKSHSLTFKNVTFGYEGSTKNAIDDISFTVKEGETVALVGPSGGGKTTIARLAARFWDVTAGEVCIGDVNVKDLPKETLMDTVSFVFQNTKLFKGTLRENVVFGNTKATESDIQKALDASQAAEIIEALPQGLDTVMGTKGTYLSGGEAQRIALARAMVKNAPIVLLDEATAFADPENEHLIQKALKSLSRQKTTLMIAHRLTSVRDADQILVIDQGKIVESGKHDALIEKNGLYKTMWDEYQKSIDWKITSNQNVK